jgi:hypothetical protein
MSSAKNIFLGNAARSSLALASLSLGANFVGSSTASRHTIASLFKLRRCISAALFKRSYTASGMFFNVKVVGMSCTKRQPKWLHCGTGQRVPPSRHNAQPSLNQTHCGMRLADRHFTLGFHPHTATLRLVQTMAVGHCRQIRFKIHQLARSNLRHHKLHAQILNRSTINSTTGKWQTTPKSKDLHPTFRPSRKRMATP